MSFSTIYTEGGNKLNLNLKIAGLIPQETYTSTDTSRHGDWASMGLIFLYAAYWTGCGRLG